MAWVRCSGGKALTPVVKTYKFQRVGTSNSAYLYIDNTYVGNVGNYDPASSYSDGYLTIRGTRDGSNQGYRLTLNRDAVVDGVARSGGWSTAYAVGSSDQIYFVANFTDYV